MKTSSFFHLANLFLVAAHFLLLALSVSAQTWDGGGIDDNWTTAANWNPDSTPAANGTASIIFGGATRLFPNVNSAQDILSLTFNNTASPFTIGGTSTLTIRAGITNNDADTQTINAPIVIAASQAWKSASGPLNFGGPTISASGPTVSLTIDTPQPVTISNRIDSSLVTGLGKFGLGTLTLSVSNSYGGPTLVNGGRLTAAANSALPNGMTVVVDTTGELFLNAGVSETIDQLAGSGNVTMQSGSSLTVGSASVDFNFPGKISGLGFVTKIGTGVMTLASSNSFSSSLTISNGTVRLGTNDVFADTVSLSLPGPSAATFDVNGFTDVIGGLSGGPGGNISLPGASSLTVSNVVVGTAFNGVISGSSTATFIKAGSNGLNLGGSNTFAGTYRVSQGNLQITSSDRIADAADIIVEGGNFNLTGSLTDVVHTVTLASGSIGGVAGFSGPPLFIANSFDLQSGSVSIALGGLNGLTKNTTGLVSLSGSNIYNGATTINGGVLALATNNVLPDATTVVLASLGTLRLSNGVSEAIDVVSGGGSVELQSGATLAIGIQNGGGNFLGTIFGAGSLTKLGAATQTFSGSNTFTGSLTVSNGSVLLGTNNVFADSMSLSLPGPSAATFDVNGFAEVIGGLSGGPGGNISLPGSSSLTVSNVAVGTAFNGVISGASTATFIKTGINGLNLGGSNTFAGTYRISQGSLQITSSDRIADAADIIVEGGNFNLTGSLTDVVHNVTLSSGSIGGFPGFSGPPLFIANAFDLQSGSVSVALGGVNGLTKNTTGLVSLSGSNTYNGATTINGGVLALATNNVLPDATSVLLASLGTLRLSNGVSDTIDAVSGGGSIELQSGSTLAIGIQNSGGNFLGTIFGAGSLTKLGLGTQTFSGSNTFTGSLTISNGSVQLGANNVFADTMSVSLPGPSAATFDVNGFTEVIGGLSGGAAGNLALAASSSLTVSNTSSAAFSGAISGSSTGTFIKSGAGLLTLAGANTFPGTYRIGQGTLAINLSDRLADAANLIVDAGAFQMGGTITDTVAVVMLTNNGTLAAAGSQPLLVGSAFNLETGTVGVRLGGLASLTKNSAGTLTFTATNSYSGATTINNGVLAEAINNVLPDSTTVTVNSPGSLRLSSGFSDTIAGLAGSGSVEVQSSATLSVGSLDTASSFPGTIFGAGTFIKIGTNLLTLSGANTLSGTLAVSAGTMRLGANNVLPDAATVNVNGTLDVNGFTDTFGALSGSSSGNVSLPAASSLTTSNSNGAITTFYFGTISGSSSATFIKGGAYTLQLQGSNSLPGTYRVSQGTLQISGSDRLADAADLIVEGGIYQMLSGTDAVHNVTMTSGALSGGLGRLLNASAFNVLSGAITLPLGGNATLTKSTSGAVTLGANGAYSGGTVISDGTLDVTVTDALPDTGLVTANSPGTLQYESSLSDTIAGLSGNGSVVLVGTAALSVGNNDSNSTFAGVISGGGSVTKIGNGTLALAGSSANTFTGLTTVRGGTLLLNKSAGQAPFAGNLVIGDGVGGPLADILQLASNDQIPDGASVTITNSGFLNLSGFADTIGVLSMSGGDIASGAGTLTLAGDVTVIANSSQANISGNLNLDGVQRQVTVGDGAAANDLDISAVVSNGGLNKLGLGTLRLSGANTFAGGVNHAAGVIAVGNNAALGTGGFTNVGGTIQADGAPRSVNNTFVVAGGTVAGSLDLSFTGPVIVSGSPTLTVSNTGLTTFSAGVSGTGAFTKRGTGTLVYSGSIVHTHTGDTLVHEGTLALGHAVTDGAIHGNLIIGDGLGGANADVVRLNNSDQIASSATVTVNGSGLLNLNGKSETISALTMNGGSVDTGGGTFGMAGNVTGLANATTATITNGSLDLNGAARTFTIADGAAAVDMDVSAQLFNGSLIKDGAGTLSLSHPAGAGIAVTLNAGALQLNLIRNGGSLTQNGGSIGGSLTNQGTFVYNGGTFSGQLVNQGATLFNANFTAGNGLMNFVTMAVGVGATLTLNGSGLNNQGSLTLSGGTLAGNGPLLNNSSLSGFGSISGSGGFTNNALLTLSGGNLTLDNTGLNANFGNIDLAPGLQLRLNGGPLYNGGSINLNSGIIAGSATLTSGPGGSIAGRGTISSPFNNNGGMVLLDAGTLNISQNFSNSGTVQLTAAAANLTGGAIANNGTIQGLGNIGNALNNSGTVEAIGGTLNFSGSIINTSNGLMTALWGAKILASSGMANNAGVVSLSGGTFDNNNRPLNNTGQISGYGALRSGGLANNGSVTFSGGTSTINGNLTNSAGKRVTVAYNPAIFTGIVVNNGTFKVTSTTAQFTGLYLENGTFTSDPATNLFAELIIGASGYFTGGAGDVFSVSGDLSNASSQSALWNTANAELVFKGGPGHTFALAGADAGPNRSGYSTNFAWKTFRLGGGESLTLADGNGVPGAALYTKQLILEAGLAQISSITGNGLNIYYDPLESGNAYLASGTYPLNNGGAIIPVNTPPIQIVLLTLLANEHAQLTCSGIPNVAHSVQASTNLTSWTTIGSATADANGNFQFEDVNAASFAARLYRLSVP